MLLSIQFPFADLREFIEDTGKLTSPVWPLPTPNKEFIRRFGGIRIRKQGGIEGWIGESEICEANNAMQFCDNLSFGESGSKNYINLRCAFRRLYFDGWAVGKYEVGIAPKKAKQKKVNLSKKESQRFFDHILSLPVKLNDRDNQCYKLINAGKPLTQMYLDSTTKNGCLTKIEDWWAMAGTPMLFFDCQSDNIGFPYWIKFISLPQKYGLLLANCLIPYAGTQLRMWILWHHTDLDQSRVLRISLMRLYAEHECLRLVLRSIMNHQLSVTPRSPQSDQLQRYFNNATSRINRLENSAYRQFDSEIIDLARQSMNTISPGQREALLGTLESLDIRKNIFRNLREYTNQWENITLVEVGQMGDIYNVNGQAGAVGANAHAHDMVYQQMWTKVNGEIDLPTLTKELGVLRSNLKQEASEPSHDIAVGSVAAAETEAQRGNGAKALEYLAKAGKWAFDTAVKIGVTVAAAALKEALGIK